MTNKHMEASWAFSRIVSSTFLNLILITYLSCSSTKYDSLEISYPSSPDGIRLSGTLTIPKGDRLYPAVLLVQGTGSHNRDEEVLGHKLFEVIADYLTKKGIAVLRVDRRGCGKSEGTYVNLDMEHYVEDAVSGIRFLKSYTNIDSNRIGIVGHSLGGLIAAISSSRTSDISFIISCGGPGIWGKDIGYSLNKLWAECSGAKREDYDEIKRLSYRWYELITMENVTQKEADEFTQIYIQLSNYMSDDLRRLFYPGPADKAFSVFRTPEFSKAIQIDPLSVWKNVHCFVLAINGSKDYQASADENLKGIRNGLIAGKNTHYTIVTLKNHNHLFQRTENGSPAEYARIKESFSPITLNLMSKWILSLTDPRQTMSDIYNDPDAIAEEAPLPDNLTITKPNEQVRENRTVLSGFWYGRWDSSLAVQLAIENINDYEASVVYSWADHPMGYFQKGWMRKTAKANTAGDIEFENGNAVWKFKYDRNKDVLIGTYKDQYVALTMIMNRKKER
jgi:uncharacterized protein